MSQKSIKTAAELESSITAELREHLVCESARVVQSHPWDLVKTLLLSATGQGPIVNAPRGSQKLPLGFAQSSIGGLAVSTAVTDSNRARAGVMYPNTPLGNLIR